MKRAEFVIAFALVAAIIGSTLVAVALRHSEIVPENLSGATRTFEPPENATIIPDLGQILFSLSLNGSEVVIPKGQSRNIMVVIDSFGKADILLKVGASEIPEMAVLPPRIAAHFSQAEVHIEPNSQDAVTLSVSIAIDAPSGIYELHIFADQKTSYGSAVIGVPLRVIIP